MTDSNFSHEDSLRLINQMIAQAKHKPRSSDSYQTLLWGYLVLVAALLHHYLLSTPWSDYAPAAWSLMLVGMAFSVWIAGRQREAKRIKTYVDDLVGQVWLGWGIAFVVLSFALQPAAAGFFPMLMLLYGMALWMQGAVIRFWWYQAGGALCLVGGGIGFLLSAEWHLPLLAGVVLLGYLVPGHILHAQKN